ncbi:hypothetical protein Zmor_008467 [Zophobas morio]|uniref:Uncharacterized protein n=1 Tax=Zophobas morio TaxID=2755281 RepID=A0AA38IY66_9CUCU|nr:hypothetical protein Zmor_008467 [Zophobas morio]
MFKIAGLKAVERQFGLSQVVKQPHCKKPDKYSLFENKPGPILAPQLPRFVLARNPQSAPASSPRSYIVQHKWQSSRAQHAPSYRSKYQNPAQLYA